MEKILDSLRSQFSMEKYGELLNMDTLKSSFLSFESHAIISYVVDSSSRMRTVYLHPDYDKDQELDILVDNILHFVTF